jgi:hypothetical protein
MRSTREELWKSRVSLSGKSMAPARDGAPRAWRWQRNAHEIYTKSRRCAAVKLYQDPTSATIQYMLSGREPVRVTSVLTVRGNRNPESGKPLSPRARRARALREVRCVMCVWNSLTLSGSGGDRDKPSISNFRFRPVLSDLELKAAVGLQHNNKPHRAPYCTLRLSLMASGLSHSARYRAARAAPPSS